MKRICVFCGSSPGSKPGYLQAAKDLGYALTEKNIGLVFGGGSIGIMGEIASAVLERGGEAIGVIPQNLLKKELAHKGLSELRVVDSMHERKAQMAEISEGFISLPGGLGTTEEFFEMLTWTQLDIHQKPCGLLNVNGYFNKLLEFIDHAIDQQFIAPENRAMLLVDENPQILIGKLESYRPLKIDKIDWVRKMNKRE